MEVENENGELIKFDVHPQAMLYYKKQEMQIAPYNRTLGSKSKRRLHDLYQWRRGWLG